MHSITQYCTVIHSITEYCTVLNSITQYLTLNSMTQLEILRDYKWDLNWALQQSLMSSRHSVFVFTPGKPGSNPRGVGIFQFRALNVENLALNFLTLSLSWFFYSVVKCRYNCAIVQAVWVWWCYLLILTYTLLYNIIFILYIL